MEMFRKCSGKVSSKTPQKGPGPLLGTIWWVLTVVIVTVVAYSIESNAYLLVLGFRSAIAFVGYLVMQIALWFAEFRWDEKGSTAYLEVNHTKITKIARVNSYLLESGQKLKQKSVDFK